MQLLIVPIALLLITLAFTWQQDARQQEIEDRRAHLERSVEEQRAQAEREIQEERAEYAPWLPSGRSGALCACV
jgi:Flp pilus assembly protein TadB